MSRPRTNTQTFKSVPKPFCKVCFDSGKPENEYTSHYVRSLPDHNGYKTVTCPVLRNTECKKCYQKGHTAKFCVVKFTSKKSNFTDVKKVIPVNPVKKDTFSVLYESDDEDDIAIQCCKEVKFSSIPISSIPKFSSFSTEKYNWADDFDSDSDYYSDGPDSIS
jgi:hypothetical protein